MNDAVSLVQVHILHAKIPPLAKEFVEFLASLNLGRVECNDVGSRLDLENPGKPVVVGN